MRKQKGLSAKISKENSAGFALLEGILILVIIAMLGGSGYYVWKVKSDSNKSLDNAASTNLAASKKKEATKQTVPRETSNEQKIDEKLFTLTLPRGWEKVPNNASTGVDGVGRFRYENKSTGEFFLVEIDQTSRGALYGDYNWYYVPDVREVGTIKINDDSTKCVEDNQSPDTCPEDDKQLTIYILPYEGEIKLKGHTYHFLAGNEKKQDGQGLQVFRDIIVGFKAK